MKYRTADLVIACVRSLREAAPRPGVDLGASSKHLPAWLFESRRRYFVKNRGPLYALLADLAWLSGHLLWLLRSCVLGATKRAPPTLLGDFLRHSVLVRGFSL